jgi:hypothetical protein
MGGIERHFISGRRRSILLLQGSQAMPARPSDKIRMEVKTLVSDAVEAWERGRDSGIFTCSLLYDERDNSERQVILWPS